MISKGFLSGIFSVVSFIFISTFAIPSTFAQCPPDVSGTWVIRFKGINECCPDSSENGPSGENSSFVVTQVGNEISALWVDEGNDQHVITGVVNGKAVYLKMKATGPDNPECTWIVHAIGIIEGRKGNRIRGITTNGEYTCDDCVGHDKFTVKIVK